MWNVSYVLRSLKSFSIAFIVSAIITFASLAANTYFTTLNEVWKERKIPYDIKWDYLWSNQLIMARVILLNYGFDKDGILLKILEKLHKSKYEKAISKVPEDDGIRVVLWYYYEIVPLLFCAEANSLPYIIPEALKVLKLAVNLHSRSKYIEIGEKYRISNQVLSFFTTSQNSFLLFAMHNRWLPQAILYSTLLAQNAAQLDLLMQLRDVNIEPLRLMINAFILNLNQILLRYYKTPEMFYCKAPEVYNIRYYMNTFPELCMKYRDSIFFDKVDYNKAVAAFEINYSKTRKFLLDKCNIHVRYDTFPPTK
jgi:hypothetical protein